MNVKKDSLIGMLNFIIFLENMLIENIGTTSFPKRQINGQTWVTAV